MALDMAGNSWWKSAMQEYSSIITSRALLMLAYLTNPFLAYAYEIS